MFLCRLLHLTSARDVLATGAGLRKHYAKAVYKFVSGRSFRGKWGGKLRRFAPPHQSCTNALVRSQRPVLCVRSTSCKAGGLKVETWALPLWAVPLTF